MCWQYQEARHIQRYCTQRERRQEAPCPQPSGLNAGGQIVGSMEGGQSSGRAAMIGESPIVSIGLKDVSVPFLLDTVSQVTMLAEGAFSQLFGHGRMKLQDPSTWLALYGHHNTHPYHDNHIFSQHPFLPQHLHALQTF